LVLAQLHFRKANSAIAQIPHECWDLSRRQFPGGHLHLFALSINNRFVMHGDSQAK
jgi:hypothetical protein